MIVVRLSEVYNTIEVQYCILVIVIAGGEGACQVDRVALVNYFSDGSKDYFHPGPFSTGRMTLTGMSDQPEQQRTKKKTPVSILSGFLGSGKSTVLRHLLHNTQGWKIAVLVNDMAELNVDAEQLSHVISQENSDERLVSLSNGCICCTLREDLWVELAKLATLSDIDYILVESSGISEPLPVAETFTFRDSNGVSLGDVVELDALITVVDASTFCEDLAVLDDLRTRGWQASNEDERTVAQLLCDQVEFANILLVNKMDLIQQQPASTGSEACSENVSEAKGKQMQNLLRLFNPTAKIISTEWGKVDPSELLNTHLFDFEAAEKHPDWLQEARTGEHVPETIEYGISSITFRSDRPMNVSRFEELTSLMENTQSPLLRGIASEKENQINSNKDSSTFHNSEDGDGHLSQEERRAAQCVIRSKGLVWLGSRQGHWQQGMASLAGQRFTLSFSSPWLGAIHYNREGDQPSDAIDSTHEVSQPTKENPWGDRRTELVVIGQNMDHDAIRKALQSCVLTEDEMNEYTKQFLYSQPLDILDESQVDGELADKIKQYKIEILLPKEKKTQVLVKRPKSTEAISAHACLAIYEGADSATGKAKFKIVRYLRYAHLIADLASGLVKEFEIPLDSADMQTALLVDETTGDILSRTIAYLEKGDKVDLEWLQIRVEYDNVADEDRFHIIQQCQKLGILDEATEKQLTQQYPSPQIMVKKDQMTCHTSPSISGKQGKGKKGAKTKGKKKGRNKK